MPVPAILTLNAGSSSLKFAAFGADPGAPRLLQGAVERLGEAEARFWMHDAPGNSISDHSGDLYSYDQAFARVLAAVPQAQGGLRIVGVGHRVAHGGTVCDCPKRVTPELLSHLRSLVHLAPLHLPGNIRGMEAISALQPELSQVACFDTAFHHNLPQVAQMTGLPPAIGGDELRRYGYHGLSCEYIISRLRADGIDTAGERIIIAHLGNGASLTAIRDGRSIETTMGFSTVSGVPMGSRSGDVDPGLLLYLLCHGRVEARTLERILYDASGLLGLSGISNDMRVLLGRREESAGQAIDYFCYHARKQIAALTAPLGGLDRIVFTGGIGINAPLIRARICGGLGYLGIALDADTNGRGEGVKSASRSRVTVEARRTDEEAMIAEHVRGIFADELQVTEETA